MLCGSFSFRRPNKKFREALILAGGRPFNCPPANHKKKQKTKKRVTRSKTSHTESKKGKSRSVGNGRKRKKPMISESDSSSDNEDKPQDLSPLSCISISSDDD